MRSVGMGMSGPWRHIRQLKECVLEIHSLVGDEYHLPEDESSKGFMRFVR